MKPSAKRLYAATAVLLLVAGAAGQARADFIPWSYNWTPRFSSVAADNPAMGAIKLSTESGGPLAGDNFTIATRITTASTAAPATPATFTNAGYGLTLAITDEASQATGRLTFSGVFNGTLSSATSTLTNTYTGPARQSLQIGNHLYTVQVGPFGPILPPGPAPANPRGNVAVLASVAVADVPEPSTLVLAGLCLGVCGAGWWWRRGRALALGLG